MGAKVRNIRLILQYEGTRYQGWQRQESTENTIQGRLEALLGKMTGEKIELIGSGRTDAGVHALGQIANFHTESTMTEEAMLTYINRYLPEDIAVTQVRQVQERFHSRLNARGKCYRYQIINSGVPDVFRRRYALKVEEALDLEAMKAAAALLCGEHDFKAFTSAKKSKKKSTVRRIDKITVDKEGSLVTLTFKGNGFLFHMVRILTGTLLEVGTGKRKPEDMLTLLRSGNREDTGNLVPANGLTLVEVYY